MDWNAPHAGFVIAAYALSAVLLVLLVWSGARVARRREEELKRLEADIAARKRKP